MHGVIILMKRSRTSPEGEHPRTLSSGPEDKLALCVRCSSLQGKSKRSINELLESLDIVAQVSVFLESERAKHARKLPLSRYFLG